MATNLALGLVLLTSVGSFVLNTPFTASSRSDIKMGAMTDKLYTFEKSAKVFAEAKVNEFKLFILSYIDMKSLLCRINLFYIYLGIRT